MNHVSLVIGWLAVAVGIFVNIPQAYQIWKNKSAKDVAPLTYWLLLFVVIGYLIRAVAIREAIFIVSNSLAILITVTVLLLYYKYH